MRPGLQNGTAFPQDADHGFELRPRHREGSALDGGDALFLASVAEIRAGGDDDAGSAVDLPEQLFVYQHAAVFRGEQIRPASRCQTDFEAPATGLGSDLSHGVVFPYFPIFELRDPHFAQPLSLQQPYIVVAEDVTLRKKFPSALTKNGAAENLSG